MSGAPQSSCANNVNLTFAHKLRSKQAKALLQADTSILRTTKAIGRRRVVGIEKEVYVSYQVVRNLNRWYVRRLEH